MRHLQILTAVFLIAGSAAVYAAPASAADSKRLTQDYVREPMPPGVQVVVSDLEGPVFADATGHTFYSWPIHSTRNGSPGEAAGKIQCTDEHYRVTAGFTSPYPGGTLLPDADTRPTCVQHWPPVLAPAGAKPVGNWGLLDRPDGTKQWAYKRAALYTSHLDHNPGETNGGTTRQSWDALSQGAPRRPLMPAPALPAQFKVATAAQGRILENAATFSVYSYDKDTATKSNCYGSCLDEWVPMIAPEAAAGQGDWSIIQRTGGEKQWTYRSMPLYTHKTDPKPRSYVGSDTPGWHNVFMQRAPVPPKGFHSVDTRSGQVIADATGKTIYFYSCVEDTADTLYCDTPADPQVYRLAVCGAGDPERCVKTFPYVIADKGAKTDNVTWRTHDIDPKSGRYVAAGTPGSLHIWTYRDRPIYTFSGDKEPGDIWADSWGQDHGQRNGFKAIWLRDDFRFNDSSEADY